MKTRIANILTIILISAAFGCARAQDFRPPEWTMMVKVVDEGNQPITNASVKVWWHIPPPEGQSIAMTNVTGFSGEDGKFVISDRSGSIEVICEATKDGYYGSGHPHEFAKFQKNDPTKWNPTIILLLKKIGKPIPMYAKSATNLKLPVLGKPVGYDLMAGDWIAPYGTGVNADIIFAKEYNEKAANDYYSKITVRFPKDGDGIREFTVPDVEKGSALRSPHEAPADGYQSELTREVGAHPGQPSKFDYDPNRIYFFRVRTVLDEQGKVKSTFYGKIYGDFMQFCYYLNPTPNDRNIEFDPKRNLLKGLKSTEQVTAP